MWLEKGLASSTAPAKLIACGMIWNGATRPNKTDHWCYWPHEIERLFRFIGKHKIKGVTLIGGDIHRSRVIRHAAADQAGYDIIELITSPMHNSIIEAANAPHPGLMWDAGAIYTYLAVDIDHRSSKAPMLRARFMNRDGKELFKTSIPLTQ
jgi:alkaline phosphatase D